MGTCAVPSSRHPKRHHARVGVRVIDDSMTGCDKAPRRVELHILTVSSSLLKHTLARCLGVVFPFLAGTALPTPPHGRFVYFPRFIFGLCFLLQ